MIVAADGLTASDAVSCQLNLEHIHNRQPVPGRVCEDLVEQTLDTATGQHPTQPRSFDSLGLVPFQISPHYLDPDPASTHMGETQEERILQFLEENETPVVGMREGAWLLIENGSVTLKGSSGARIFRRGHASVEVPPGTEISEVVGAPDAI